MKIIILTLCAVISSFVFADSNLESAKKIVMEGNENGAVACMGCHQENGEGMQENGYPQLAGHNANYLSKQLKDFKGKNRVSDIMGPIAKGLSDQDILDVTAYYSKLPAVSKVEKSTSEILMKEGQIIAERGIWNKGVPACFACHGPNAVGVGETFPPLLNQGKLYITTELNAWQKGTRKNDPAMLMKTIAKKLTKKEIAAVSEYLASLSEVKTAEVK